MLRKGWAWGKGQRGKGGVEGLETQPRQGAVNHNVYVAAE